MIKEQEIAATDLVIILKDVLFSGCLFGLKTTTQTLEDCNLIDFNEEGERATVIYSNRSKPALARITLKQVVSIEFELPYDYKGGKINAFIIR